MIFMFIYLFIFPLATGNYCSLSLDGPRLFATDNKYVAGVLNFNGQNFNKEITNEPTTYTTPHMSYALQNDVMVDARPDGKRKDRYDVAIILRSTNEFLHTSMTHPDFKRTAVFFSIHQTVYYCANQSCSEFNKATSQFEYRPTMEWNVYRPFAPSIFTSAGEKCIVGGNYKSPLPTECLNMVTMTWRVAHSLPEVHRDEHTSLMHNRIMYVCGGFTLTGANVTKRKYGDNQCSYYDLSLAEPKGKNVGRNFNYGVRPIMYVQDNKVKIVGISPTSDHAFMFEPISGMTTKIYHAFSNLSIVLLEPCSVKPPSSSASYETTSSPVSHESTNEKRESCPKNPFFVPVVSSMGCVLLVSLVANIHYCKRRNFAAHPIHFNRSNNRVLLFEGANQGEHGMTASA